MTWSLPNYQYPQILRSVAVRMADEGTLPVALELSRIDRDIVTGMGDVGMGDVKKFIVIILAATLASSIPVRYSKRAQGTKKKIEK